MKIILTFVLIFNFHLVNAQYLADMVLLPDDKGVIGSPSCSNVDITTCTGYDVTGLNWSLSSPGNTFDLTSANHGFYTKDGFLRIRDIGNNGVLCFESPVLSMTGSTQTVNLIWDDRDFNGQGELILLEGGLQHFYAFNPSDNMLTVNFNPTGTTLQFKVCMTSSASTGRMDFYEISSTATVVLPVELLNFNAHQAEDKSITLEWKTATELNNWKFEIEESQDGQKFEKIGIINGNGTSYEEQNYSFRVEKMQQGIIYYRLKQIDYDEQFEYSEVISVNHKKEVTTVGNFYPNPSNSGFINLDYNAQYDDEIIVSAFDITGKLVTNEFQQVLKGNNNLNFDFSTLNKGIYIVKIGNDINSTYRKLIIE